MQLLLDTHIMLWAFTDDVRLRGTARGLIRDERNSVWISAVSIWEIAIKHSLGRGEMPISAQQALSFCRDAGYLWLDIRPEHAAAVETLPQLHTDPFDRLLVAQAITEPLRLVTRDGALARYDQNIVRV